LVKSCVRTGWMLTDECKKKWVRKTTLVLP
jgi:hypothetical protein